MTLEGLKARLRARIRRNHFDVSAHEQLGRLLFGQRRFSEAVNPLKRACELAPESCQNHVLLGKCFYELQKFDEAVVSLCYARYLDREQSGDAKQFIGLSLQQLGRHSEAASYLIPDEPPQVDDPSELFRLGKAHFDAARYEAAEEQFQRASRISGPSTAGFCYWLGKSQFRLRRWHDAEQSYVRSLTLDPSDDQRADIYNDIGIIRKDIDERPLDAAAMFRQAITHKASEPLYYTNLSKTLQSLAMFTEAAAVLQSAVNLGLTSDEIERELAHLNVKLTPALSTFEDFIEDGSVWLESCEWQNPESSTFLRMLFENGITWAKSTELLFDDYLINHDSLEESLAIAESLSDFIRRDVELPIWLFADEFFVVLARERNMLRGFVGIDRQGLAVSVNLDNWDLMYLEDDRDAMFAAGVVLHFFFDCSINLAMHPKFTHGEGIRRCFPRRGDSVGSTWSTSKDFDSDLVDIRSGRASKPPRAHRVAGHIRTLDLRSPTDEARERAPAYIRHRMGPTDTYVRSYDKGGSGTAAKIYNRLATQSSLADFLAMAPRTTE
jgi:Flp pilus assembly protein TadD